MGTRYIKDCENRLFPSVFCLSSYFTHEQLLKYPDSTFPVYVLVFRKILTTLFVPTQEFYSYFIYVPTTKSSTWTAALLPFLVSLLLLLSASRKPTFGRLSVSYIAQHAQHPSKTLATASGFDVLINKYLSHLTDILWEQLVCPDVLHVLEVNAQSQKTVSTVWSPTIADVKSVPRWEIITYE